MINTVEFSDIDALIKERGEGIDSFLVLEEAREFLKDGFRLARSRVFVKKDDPKEVTVMVPRQYHQDEKDGYVMVILRITDTNFISVCCQGDGLIDREIMFSWDSFFLGEILSHYAVFLNCHDGLPVSFLLR